MRSVLLLALMLAAPAYAQTVRPPDAARLEAFHHHLGLALHVALARGTAADRAVLVETLSGAAGPLVGAEGAWACRTLKLGGITDLTVYPNFRCRISRGSDGLVLIKETGSQRLKGRILEDGTFLGVGHVGTAPATDYAGLPPLDQTPVEPNQTTADVGRFELLSPDRARLMLPAPLLESRFDLLYLTR
ncbi:DUF4893 domain-containing protein [Jannaschia seohaensis]|uniref:Uncharacterized protein DUF4893 n=1 Tax=Jannaschia seohaensis TaxID=475081 RepID=A0A2Y9AYE6_9RHOB|nr:DUF4893 domain-containing protein [Jannaschia seohaensis]PWJ16231.1 uncharacterized protein DUF4893 [Jannaschia seohaensis]SSA49294.1 protein of unknown function [Jannaschia seohaensis]